MALAHDRPPLFGYEQDQWTERLGYADADVDQAVRELTVLRDAWHPDTPDPASANH